MYAHAIAIERRQYPREGILGELENITYGVLRKYGISGEPPREVVVDAHSTADNRKEDTTMVPNLVVAVSNPKPNREKRYPGTWLLYTQGRDPVEVHVVHDSDSRPHVLDGAA